MIKPDSFFYFLIITGTSLSVYEGFVEPTTTIKWIAFQLIILIGAILFIGRNIKKKILCNVDAIYLCVTSAIFYIIIRVFIASPHHTFFIYNFVSFWLAYSFFIINNNSLPSLKVNKILLLIGVVLSVWGILHFIQNYTFVTGSFDNPAGFSISLSCIFPFACELIQKTTLKKKKTLYYIGGIIIFSSVLISQSRTGTIACTVVLFFYIFRHQTYIQLLLFCFLLVIAIFCKSDSTSGRIFIYKTSTSMINKKTILCGTGSGNFKCNYMNFQAKAFQKDKDNKYAILASNVFHPFNEYLLLLVEYGLVGLIILIILFILLFTCKEKKEEAKLCLLIIMITSSFSYPFRYPLVSFLLAYSLASFKTKRIYKIEKPIYCIKSFIIIICCYGVCNICDEALSQYTWKKQLQNVSFGYFEKAYLKYHDLYNKMFYNPYFLFNYSSVLYENMLYNESLKIAKECTKYLNDYDTEMLLADNYWKLKYYQEAEKHYLKASYMCPVRFMPLFKLYELYKEQERINEAQLLGKKILEKPIKIYSSTIETIRQKIQSDNIQDRKINIVKP
ncbi:O-antigen ligase family protein [Phocaeicola sp.]|uniref:O-antigen ligase family protein n=1 Tax=Phocaeicola sp. TaxID=2773926 RepID=UPI0023BCD7AB|nr:O-antigen ligase family protein [Phocaeicola sp.]MDE5678461.1 O-antigen ligase family protein [Phocaeicola sp.]